MKLFFLFSVCMILFACTNKNGNTAAKKQMQPAPAIFRLATDSTFSAHQDTLFFGGQKFSGFNYMLYPNGDTSFSIAFVNGLQEGWCRKWYPNKQLAEERQYNKGKKEGMQKAWWPNGNTKWLFEAADDVYTGEFKEWNSSGALIKLFHYAKGQEEGSQQLFYDNGKIRSNYVIISGRRYGLLGTKNCVNASDSIFNKR